jgi:amidase
VAGDELMATYLDLLLPIFAAGYPDALYESFAAQREADLRAIAEGAGELTGAGFRVRSTATYRDVMHAMVRRQAMKDRLEKFFGSGIDAVLCPLGPVAAFKHSQDLAPTARTLDVDGTRVPYMSLLTWIALATALHNPAMAVPAGQTTSGVPVGVQLVGPWRCEDRLFDFASVLEEELGGFKPPAL